PNVGRLAWPDGDCRQCGHGGGTQHARQLKRFDAGIDLEGLRLDRPIQVVLVGLQLGNGVFGSVVIAPRRASVSIHGPGTPPASGGNKFTSCPSRSVLVNSKWSLSDTIILA